MSRLQFEPPAPLPHPVTFDYWTHEYWRLGQMYRELCQWQNDLEGWERDLLSRSSHRSAHPTAQHPHQSQSSNRGRGRRNRQPHLPPFVRLPPPSNHLQHPSTPVAVPPTSESESEQ